MEMAGRGNGLTAIIKASYHRNVLLSKSIKLSKQTGTGRLYAQHLWMLKECICAVHFNINKTLIESFCIFKVDYWISIIIRTNCFRYIHLEHSLQTITLTVPAQIAQTK